MRRRLLTLSGILLAALLLGPAAFADTFDFNFSGSGFTASGTFTASATAMPGTFLINSVTGTTDGTAIAGLLPPGNYPPTSSGDFPNDNLLFSPLRAGGALDSNGFSYDLTDGTDINIFYFSGRYFLVTGPSLNGFVLSSFSITDTTTGVGVTGTAPEPGSFFLLGTGALGIAGAIRRKFSV